MAYNLGHNIKNAISGVYMKEKIIKTIKCILYIKEQYNAAHIAAYSAEAAFFMLISAVPLVMIGIIILSALAPLDFIGVQQMLSRFFTQHINEYIIRILTEIRARATVPFFSATMFFLLLSATRGIRSIAQGIEMIYNCGNGYNIFHRTFRSIIYTAVMLLVGAFSAAVLVFASPMEKLAAEVLGDRAKFILVIINIRNLLFFVVLTLLFSIAYHILARNTFSFKQQLWGGAFAASGWLIYSYGYSVYIRHFSKYSLLYGSLGAVMLFMLWLYMCMNILLCGALLNRLKSKGFKQ